MIDGLFQGRDSLLLGTNQTYTLGRSRRNNIHLKDVTVNNKHATIKTADNHVDLQDDNSVSGTWVNKERISKPFRLKTGDVIVFGKDDCKYVFLDPNFVAVIDERIEKLTRFALDLTLKNLNVKTTTHYSSICTHYVTKLVTIDSLMDEPILHFLLERKSVITVKYFIDILANISEAPLMPNIYRYMPEIDHFLKSKGIVDINPRKNRSLIFAKVIFINFNVEFHDKVCPIISKCGGDTTIYVKSERFYIDLFQNWNRTVYVAVPESVQSDCEPMTQFSETMLLKGKRFITMEPHDIYIKILKGDPINNLDDSEVVHLPNTLEEVIPLDSSDEDDLLPDIEKQIISKPAKQKRRKNNQSPPQLYKAYKPYKTKPSYKKYFLRDNAPSPTLDNCITSYCSFSSKKNEQTTNVQARNANKRVAETRMQHIETGLTARKDNEQDNIIETSPTLIQAYILTCNESLSNSSKTSLACGSLDNSQESFVFDLSPIGNRERSKVKPTTLLNKRPVSVNSQYADVSGSSADSEVMSTKKKHF